MGEKLINTKGPESFCVFKGTAGCVFSVFLRQIYCCFLAVREMRQGSVHKKQYCNCSSAREMKANTFQTYLTCVLIRKGFSALKRCHNFLSELTVP